MTFIDWFAGVGGFRRGLELAGHKCVGFCEWDKFAVASYTSMHLITDKQREKLAVLDIKKRQKEILREGYRNGEWYRSDIRSVRSDDVPYADIWTFGAPCQDFSIAGKRAGLGGERSSLIREVFRLLAGKREEDRPEWIIYENVKGMLSSNRGFDFAAILVEMVELGYDIEWEVFNTKNFGIPQNRERVYVVGHLGSRGRKQIFPLKGADAEDSFREIDIIGHHKSYRRNTQIFSPTGITETLSTCQGGGRELFTAVCIPVMTPERAEKRQNGRRMKTSGEESFTLTAQDRHGVAIQVKEATKQGYAIATEGDSINLTMPDSKTRRGRVGKGQAQTLDCACNQGVIVRISTGVEVYAVWYEAESCYIAIRKLTPRECFRLQGWTDDYFDKAAFVNSDSQLYKQAGNGVTVAVVEEIAKHLGGNNNEIN